MSLVRDLLVLLVLSLSLTMTAMAADGEQTRFYLKDGSSIREVVLSETESEYVVRTSFGEITLKKEDLRTRYVRLVLKDSTILLGKLLDDGAAYVVETKLGIVKIAKDKVESFEVQFAPDGSDDSSTDLRSLFGEMAGQQEEIKSGFSHSIEPVIDIFFDPTGYTFKKGDLYISGLSLAYGFTDSFLMSVNLVSLAGLNAAEEINPNFEAKLNIVDYRGDDFEYFVAIGTKFGLLEHVGNYEITFRDEIETSRIKRRRWRDESFLHDSDMGDSNMLEQPNGESRMRIEIQEEMGWQSKFYIAQSLSFMLNRGGRLGLHLGAQLELNSFNFDELDEEKRRSHRFHLGFDIDLSRRFKLLGEIFHDVDRENNWVTDDGPVGVDFGLMYAFTKNFRIQVHIQPMLVGFYWRL